MSSVSEAIKGVHHRIRVATLLSRVAIRAATLLSRLVTLLSRVVTLLSRVATLLSRVAIHPEAGTSKLYQGYPEGSQNSLALSSSQ